MKTFDFAYWVSSLDKTQEDAPPTDRFALKAATIVHAAQDGLVEATRRITLTELVAYDQIKGFDHVGIAKITITEL